MLLELAVKFPQPLDSGVIGGLKVAYELGFTSEKEKRVGGMPPPESRQQVVPEAPRPLGVPELLAHKVHLTVCPFGLLFGQLHVLSEIGCRLHSSSPHNRGLRMHYKIVPTLKNVKGESFSKEPPPIRPLSPPDGRAHSLADNPPESVCRRVERVFYAIQTSLPRYPVSEATQ